MDARVDSIDTALRAVLSTALDATIAMRADGSIAGWNAVAERTFGWSFAEVEGRQLVELIIPSELRSRHDLGLTRYIATGEARVLGRQIEVVAIDRAGRRFPVELSTTEIRHRRERMFVGFIRDISDRKEAETRIKEVTERLELAVRAHSIGIFDTDVATRTVCWNEELERIYGYEPGEFDTTLTAWKRHVLPEDLQRVEASFKRAILLRAAEVPYTYRITRRDGVVRYIEASARLFYNADGKHVRRVGVNIDVTERKTAERSLAETQAELIHVSRLNSLGAMASSFAHELNQPLTVVANYVAAATGLLQQQENANEKVLEALKCAMDGAVRAGELIKRLRILSTKGVTEPAELSLTQMLDVTVALALHDPKLGGVTMDLAIDPEADAVFADPVLLQQVFFNLLRNAVEAMQHGGGSIAVKASATSDKEVVVEISDTGPGLDQEVESNLFSAFISTKSEGLGVGLSICRTIVEAAGGRIWANSTDHGTSFFFTLRRAGGRG